VDGAHVFIAAMGEFHFRVVHQGAEASKQEQCEIGARA
jgi:hypothetical protein